MKRVNRFLLRGAVRPQRLEDEVKSQINLSGGTLVEMIQSLTSLIEPSLTELLGYWSASTIESSRGAFNYIVLENRTNLSPLLSPLQQTGGKTKTIISEMITVLSWGLMPKMVTSDAWYSSRDTWNSKHKELGLLMGITKNRKVSLHGGKYIQIKKFRNTDEGLVVHLKSLGNLIVFQKNFKNEEHRYYIMYLPDKDALVAITRAE